MPRDVLVLFGAHALNDYLESGRFSLSPKSITLHDDWNPRITQYDGDLSLLEFEKGSIYFNDYVQPICLWSSAEELTQTEGIVTGWGKSEDPTEKHENIPKFIKISILDNAQCLPGENQLADLSSYRTFCGASKNGSGVCFGDSGGSLSVKVDGVYFLKGIVSSSLLKNEGTECDISKKAVYTNVQQFSDWISKITGLSLAIPKPVDPVVASVQGWPKKIYDLVIFIFKILFFFQQHQMEFLA